jgi:hypothetical protein
MIKFVGVSLNNRKDDSVTRITMEKEMKILASNSNFRTVYIKL